MYALVVEDLDRQNILAKADGDRYARPSRVRRYLKALNYILPNLPFHQTSFTNYYISEFGSVWHENPPFFWDEPPMPRPCIRSRYEGRVNEFVNPNGFGSYDPYAWAPTYTREIHSGPFILPPIFPDLEEEVQKMGRKAKRRCERRPLKHYYKTPHKRKQYNRKLHKPRTLRR